MNDFFENEFNGSWNHQLESNWKDLKWNYSPGSSSKWMELDWTKSLKHEKWWAFVVVGHEIELLSELSLRWNFWMLKKAEGGKLFPESIRRTEVTTSGSIDEKTSSSPSEGSRERWKMQNNNARNEKSIDISSRSFEILQDLGDPWGFFGVFEVVSDGSDRISEGFLRILHFGCYWCRCFGYFGLWKDLFGEAWEDRSRILWHSSVDDEEENNGIHQGSTLLFHLFKDFQTQFEMDVELFWNGRPSLPGFIESLNDMKPIKLN